MRSVARRFVAGVAVLLLGSACDGKTAARGGETNWSKTCRTIIDCSGAETCTGGFCVSRSGIAVEPREDARPEGGSAGAGDARNVRDAANLRDASAGGARHARDASMDAATGRDAGTLEPQCFELRAHGAGILPDESAYTVQPSEFMRSFFFNVPYEAIVQGVRFEPILDGSDTAVVQHIWLFEKRSMLAKDGSDDATIGLHMGDEFLYAWAPGLPTFELPPDVGAYLPAPGGQFEMEMLYTNSLGRTVSDRSGVRVCIAAPRSHTATLTLTGTETIMVPAGQSGAATGTCSFAGKQAARLVATMPHMHRAGRAMSVSIERVESGVDTVVDAAFEYEQHRFYPTPLALNPGDHVVTRCTYQNDASYQIGYGPSISFEECYAFIYAYPADDFVGTPGILGARNMCMF